LREIQVALDKNDTAGADNGVKKIEMAHRQFGALTHNQQERYISMTVETKKRLEREQKNPTPNQPPTPILAVDCRTADTEYQEGDPSTEPVNLLPADPSFRRGV
jgi:Trm5-related predicted tRNA methylase